MEPMGRLERRGDHTFLAGQGVESLEKILELRAGHAVDDISVNPALP